MTHPRIDPNEASFRETVYAINDALDYISMLAGQLRGASQTDVSYINERIQAIHKLSGLCDSLLGILRCYGRGSAVTLALQYPRVRQELNRIRDSFRGRNQSCCM